MADTIRGLVTNVIDGDTFDMKISQLGNNNQYEYQSSERIRITNIHVADLLSLEGPRDKQNLENAILGKEVKCFIESRDTAGSVVAQVTILC
jgi:endonuclease YncB( thermonuclease family)